MAGILKISEAVQIGIRAMMYLAIEKDRLVSVKGMASMLKVSEGHLAKVLQQIAKSKLIDSIRGPKGGFILKRDCSEIKLIEIYEIIEGSLDLDDCAFSPVCNGNCSLRKLMNTVNDMFFKFFKETSLFELINSTECRKKFNSEIS